VPNLQPCTAVTLPILRWLIEDRGLKKIQAICAVMRKLLHAIHGMLKTGQPFDGQRFYVLPKTA